MAWTTLLNALFLVGKPITSPTGLALRDNPIAIANGDAGAPRVLGKALGSTYLKGFLTSGTTPEGFTNLTGMETIRLDLSAGGITNTASLQCRFSADNGATYGSYQAIITNSSGGTANGTGAAYINLRTGAYYCFLLFGASTFSASGTLTVPANCNAFQIRNSNSTISLGGIAWCFGGLE